MWWKHRLWFSNPFKYDLGVVSALLRCPFSGYGKPAVTVDRTATSANMQLQSKADTDTTSD